MSKETDARWEAAGRDDILAYLAFERYRPTLVASRRNPVDVRTVFVHT